MNQRTSLSSLPAQPIERISVREFFAQVNWYGQSSHGTEQLSETGTPYETVGQFFSTFPWQGTIDTTPTDDWQPVSDTEVFTMEEDTLTLEDLSALF